MLTYPFTQGRLANMYKFRVITQDKILAHSRRGEHCSPVKKCDTYGIIVLFADYKFIISTKDKIQIERLIFKRDINDVPYTCES